MSSPPPLFDRVALARHRARASKGNTALFLHEEVALEVKERLSDVNRTFKNPAIVTGFPNFWRSRYPDFTIVTDDETLELEPEKHDLVIHAMALHWANDPVGQLVQCRHALMPDGLLIVALLGGQTLSELRVAISEAETRLTGGLSPRIAPMGEIRDLGALLQRAGLALPVADALPRIVSYASALHLMHDLRAMGETNTLAARNKIPASRNLIAETQRIYSETYPAEDGRIRATFELIFLTGWKPDASQQKPLQPGSAKTRLAEALNTTELGAGDKAAKPDET